MAANRFSVVKNVSSVIRRLSVAVGALCDGKRPQGTEKCKYEDYEDNEEPVEDTNFWINFKCLLSELSPDSTPISVFLMHTFFFFICVCFGPLTLPWHNQALPNGDLFDNILKDPDLSQFELILNTAIFLSLVIFSNVITLFCLMLARLSIIKVILEPLHRISKLAIIITYSVDPSLFYCMWAICNFILFRRYTINVPGDPGRYSFHFFGESITRRVWVDSRCYSWTNSIYHLHILFTFRKLVLSTLLFMFELGFLRNYSSDLKSFLSDQALLIKFNVSWFLYLKNVSKLLNQTGKSHKLIDVMANHTKVSPPESLNKRYKPMMLHKDDDFKVFRSAVYKWHYELINYNVDAKIKELFPILRGRWIRRFSANTLANWSALNHVVHNPPELILLNFSVQLVSKDTIDVASRLLFDQIYDTLSSLNSFVYKEGVNLEASVEQSPKSPVSRMSYSRQMSQPSSQPESTNNRNTVTSVPLMRASVACVRKQSDTLRRSKTIPHPVRYRSFMTDLEFPSEVCVDIPTSRKSRDSHDHEYNYDQGRVITRKMCMGLNLALVDSFFSAYDLGNCGFISSDVFSRNILRLCSARKRLLTTLRDQRSILRLVGRLISVVLWFLMILTSLLTFRVNKNIVLPSTIGFFSATIVALSYMYTSFITAIIFVVLSNPYNVGDRVRVNNGEAMYVKSITTYNTEFRCVHGKVITFQNAVLSSMTITNETRAQHATHEIILEIGTNVTPAALKQLKENFRSYINGRSRDFLKNGCYFYGSEVQIGHCYKLVIWVTCIENWSNTLVVYGLRNDILRLLASQCKLLGIEYKEPTAQIKFNNTLSIVNRSDRNATKLTSAKGYKSR